MVLLGIRGAVGSILMVLRGAFLLGGDDSKTLRDSVNSVRRNPSISTLWLFKTQIAALAVSRLCLWGAKNQCAQMKGQKMSYFIGICVSRSYIQVRNGNQRGVQSLILSNCPGLMM